MSEHTLLPAWISFLVTWSMTRNLFGQSSLWTFQQTLHKRVYTLYSTLWVLNMRLLVFLCRHKYCLKSQYPSNQFPSPQKHTHKKTYVLLRKYFLKWVTLLPCCAQYSSKMKTKCVKHWLMYSVLILYEYGKTSKMKLLKLYCPKNTFL